MMSFMERITQRKRPLVMAILNLTPDSFSDGGNLFHNDKVDLDAVLRRAQDCIDEGADLLDIGGESTRPGADAVPLSAELNRVLPVIEALRSRFDIPLSIDTSSPVLIAEAASRGAVLLNDVRALGREHAIESAAASSLVICLMHSLGEPQVMQNDPQYGDVVEEVLLYLRQRIRACEQAGIVSSRLVLDPGFGFGKTFEQNVALFRALPDFVAEGIPVMVGVSRKSMVGVMLDKPVKQRVFGSAALAVLAAQAGVAILRVHDVAATVDSLKVLRAVQG